MAGTDVEERFTLCRGDPAWRLLVWLRLRRTDGSQRGRAALALAAFVFVPLCILALVQAAGSRGLFLDLAVYTRALVALPLLLVAEGPVDGRVSDAVAHLTAAGLVGERDRSRLAAALRATVRWRSSWLAQILLLAASYAVSVLWFEAELHDGVSTWLATARPGGGERITPAGWWYALVLLPLFQFLLYRWMWRITVWSGLLWRLARMDLHLLAAHPDRMGGLGFLPATHAPFCLVVVASASVLAAAWGQQFLVAGIEAASHRWQFVFFVVVSLALIVGPLLVFVPQLARLKHEGILTYGELACSYVRRFDQRWVRRAGREEEVPLGSQDIQALADLQTAVVATREMRVFPVTTELLLLVVVAALLPMLPLIGTEIPLLDVLQRIATGLI